jgi:hypothetical protein
MELDERPNMRAVHYLNSITFADYKKACIDDAAESGEKRPEESDIKSWYNTMKKFCETNIKTKGVTRRIYAHSMMTPAGLGGRLFSGGSMQGIWSVYRGLLMRGLGTDLDQNNAHPTILKYVCGLHNIKCKELDYYISHRAECLEEFPSRKIGKNAYLVSTNNDKISHRRNAPKQFKDYDKEMKHIQKKLVELPDYKNLMVTIPEYKLTDNYNGSAINRIMCYYENIICKHAHHVVNSRGIEVAIYMFDGMMLYGDHYEDAELLRDITAHVNEQMPGLNMCWSYKPHDKTIQIPADFDENNYDNRLKYRFAEDENAAANMILSDLSGSLLACKNGPNVRVFMKRGNIWISERDTIDSHLLFLILNSNICRANTENKYIPFAQNVTPAEKIRKALLTKINEVANSVDFYDKFHTTTTGRLCFKDGVLDFEKKRFYKWAEVDFEYYSTVQIDYDFGEYFAKPDLAVVDEVQSKVFVPLFGAKTQTALSFMSRGIAGHSRDKNFATVTGPRDCGKGVAYGAMESAFPGYVKAFELTHLLYQRHMDTQESTRKRYHLMELEFVRLAVSQETPPISSGLQLDGKEWKRQVGGGDTQIARRNYDRVDTYFNIDTTFIIMGNNAIKCDTPDVFDHCLEFDTASAFKTADEIQAMKNRGESEMLWGTYGVKDEKIKDYIKTDAWRKAIVYLMIHNYTGSPVVVMRDATDEEEMSLRKKILNNYIITRDVADVILEEDVVTLLKDCKKRIRAELESMGIQHKVSRARVNCGETRGKQCFYGIKIMDDNVFYKEVVEEEVMVEEEGAADEEVAEDAAAADEDAM